ncbi:hypothetical protein TWF106_005525 [Orbilia oligospora]|uniref:F-box domain-containing protein n=1 Tax=Orbilia oligospora TaxID=2813651 RepID=A0A7C8UWR3_ORBOL|nr:hypothetical protein TWF788_001551 [Orbilia oligospora]KAF3205651.1 hypothetical protein TWF679_009202 [Orbilia oligospora]KAF3222720.1 hypothetical protein TWF106_005525 [Orbilia oligospora]
METLPPEIWLQIINFAAASEGDHLKGLINIALVSKQFHHTIFCSENDSAIWKPAAVRYGMHPNTHLDDVLFTGTSFLESRSWRTVFKFMKELQKPFPHESDVTIPKAKKVAWQLPSLKDTKEGFVRRTFEMACCGNGRGLSYSVKQPVPADRGNILFEARNIDNDKTAVAAGLLEAGEERARQASGRPRRVERHRLFPYPLPAGYMVTEEPERGGFVVSKIDPTTGNPAMSWLFGDRQPDRFTSHKDIMVAITYHGPDDKISELSNAENCRSMFVCLKANDSRKPANEVAEPIWAFDVSFDWYHPDDDYRGFAHVKNFHITSNYVVALITRHPSAIMRKITGTYFVVMDLMTGKIVREIKIHKKAVSPAEPAQLPNINGPLPLNRGSYTTAFSHDFILTDSLIVSGGPAGEILVWCISGDNASDTPIAVIPTDKYNGHQLRFTDLQLSTCGTYLALTSSKHIYIYDMISKKPIEVYDNGRVVSEANIYSSNPLDDFPSGVWVRWTDWTLTSVETSHPMAASSLVADEQKYWKRIGAGVAYLPEAGIELSYDNPLRALTVPKRRPRWVNNLRRAMHDNSSWIFLTLIGLLFAALYAILGVGKGYIAGYIGGALERVVGTPSNL